MHAVQVLRQKMKIKRYKQARRVLDFFKRNFDFHEPYQVIVDGTFSQAALKGKIQLKEQLPKYFGGEIKLVTTGCVIAELESLGKDLSGAVFIAKRFQLRSCRHGNNRVPATQCVLALIGENNPHNYFVASQDRELRKELGKIPGVPLLHIIRNTMVLEKPTRSSQRKAEQMVAARVEPSEHEKSVLAHLSAVAGDDKGKVPVRRLRKKRAKGPNPLSVKKSTKMKLSSGRGSAMAGVSRNKKRRQRMQIRRAVESISKFSSKDRTE